MNELYRSLCDALADGGEVNTTAEKFALCREDGERVHFARDLILRFELLPELKVVGKSNPASLELRESGNRAFKARKNVEALELYTRSAGFAETGSECLALAYANRSAVLFDCKLYRECLIDVDLSLNSSPPSRIREKLHRRRRNALDLLPHQPQAHAPQTPSLPSINEGIPCAAGCITIGTSEAMGRHVVATSDINIGDVLAIERPFSTLLLRNRRFTHCHSCLSPTPNLIPCGGCTEVFFCGDSCRRKALEEHHKFECPLEATLESLDVDKLISLPLRVCINARGDYGKLGRFATEGPYESERYDEIHQLVTNCERRPLGDLLRRAVKAAVICELFERHSTLFEEEETGPSNFHEISEVVGSETEAYRLEEIGAGAYAFLSLLNHSCNPNVVRSCVGTTVVLRAFRSIKQGQQLYDNYGYHFALMPKDQRRKELKEQYFFDCSCEACEEDFPLYDDLSSLGIDLGITRGEFDDLSKDGVKNMAELIERVTEMLNKLDERGVSKELAGAQEVLKHCFVLMGNKRKIVG